MNNILNNDINSLLPRFNQREIAALGEVYDLYHRELIYFAKQLYRETNIEADDVVHDVFIKIWTSENIQFKTIENIKAYIYVSIKNGFLDWLIHDKCVDRFKKIVISNPDNFITEIIESESLSTITKMTELLPLDTCTIIKLMLDGWEVKDIAQELRLSQSSIYAKKNDAIKILRNKLPKNQLLILFIISTL